MTSTALRFIPAVAVLSSCLGYVSTSSALGGAVGGGVGAAKPQKNATDEVRAPGEVGFGYAGRAYAWLGGYETLAAGITAIHVVAPTDYGTSTLTFAGIAAGAGSGFDAKTAAFGWLSIGTGYSKGACGRGVGAELGIRVDRRIGSSFRLGGGISVTGVTDDCPTDRDDTAVLPGPPPGGAQPPVLFSAIVVTLDLTYFFGHTSVEPGR